MGYLTQKEVAAELRVSERTLERMRLTGTGVAYVKFGRRVLYRRSDIDVFAEKNLRHSTSEAA